MNLKELMSTTPESLAKLQIKELKDFTIKKLRNIATLIQDGKFDEVKDYLKFSPDGDGYGTDKYFINFDYDNSNAGEGTDLSEIIDRLKNLDKIISKNEEE